MTQYAVLFQVAVLHDYFLNRGGIVHEVLNPRQQAQIMEKYATTSFLTIAPTAKTVRTLAGHQMIFKTTATGFLVAVKLDPATSDHRPAIPLASDFCLSFSLQVHDACFFNYTALSGTSSAFYRFGNRSGNEATNGQFLSLRVPAFDANRRYEADEVYSEDSSGTINLFRALRDTGPSATPVVADWERIPPDTFDPTVSYTKDSVVLAVNRLYRALKDTPGNDLSNSADWRLVSTLANQYVTSADRVTVEPMLFNLELSHAALPQATVRVIKHGENIIAWENRYQSESGNLGTVQLDLRSLSPGTYRLEVLDRNLTVIPDLGFEFYLDSTAVRDRWFGILEIGLGSGNMVLLDTSGNLLVPHPRYQLRFLNRATRWRYHFPAPQSVGTGADVVPDSTDNRILITPLPRPMTCWASGIRLQADNPGTATVSEEVLLPEPTINQIRRQDAQWYSEIYLSNLPL